MLRIFKQLLSLTLILVFAGSTMGLKLKDSSTSCGSRSLHSSGWIILENISPNKVLEWIPTNLAEGQIKFEHESKKLYTTGVKGYMYGYSIFENDGETVMQDMDYRTSEFDYADSSKTGTINRKLTTAFKRLKKGDLNLSEKSSKPLTKNSFV